MTLRTQFNDSLKDAMRAKDQRAVSTIRMILAGLKDRDIAARSRGVTDGIDEAEILSMLQTLVKQRNESAGLYDQGGRPELAQQEREEIAVIERFLPKQMSEEESTAAIDAIVTELGASSIKDMGKVMAELKARHAGQMDFAKAGGLVKARVSGK
ncbi:GatB/YqeY domain-containing protein [Azospirillum sp. TSA2s]|uniref:GatB/YqeY domain-containing protein n=1 Tax=Azospirillum sp. TSA2s TaxID=709810 RepID=UPI0010A9D29F|nr:GatB/YqeY domain-containing protein [Azospirillum sp. TSA2s]QCG98378.1 GatB/YqeY domain-containing protein [Azospirillum sp. TSA2s]